MHGPSASAAERFIVDARAALSDSSRRHVENWRLGSESRWEVDMRGGTVSFHFDDGTVLVAPIQVVGTYNARDGTFLWAWGHRTLPPALVEHASLTRRWGDGHRRADFTTPIVSCTPDTVWNFAAVTARLAGREGIYRGRSGSVWLYLTYGEIRQRTAPRPRARGPARPSPAAAGSASPGLPTPVRGRGLGRFRGSFAPDFGRRLRGWSQWFTEALQRPIDCARVTSRLKLQLARQRGQLVPLDLTPVAPVPGEAAPWLETVYVPPYCAEQKQRIDRLVTARLVRHGIDTPGYFATPEFAGRSLVPTSIRIEVTGPMVCHILLQVWDAPDDAALDRFAADDTAFGPTTTFGATTDFGPTTTFGAPTGGFGPTTGFGPVTEPEGRGAASGLAANDAEAAPDGRHDGRDGVQRREGRDGVRGRDGRVGADGRDGREARGIAVVHDGSGRRTVDPGAPRLVAPGRAPDLDSDADDGTAPLANEPGSIARAFIRDYCRWSIATTEGRASASGQGLASPGGAVPGLDGDDLQRDYLALLQRYCAADVGVDAIRQGADAIFDPEASRVVAEVFIDDRALVVVGRPVAADDDPFRTCDFEFVRDGDRWLLVDIAVVDGFDRLSMLRRQRPRAA